jgi:hypothetical protein
MLRRFCRAGVASLSLIEDELRSPLNRPIIRRILWPLIIGGAVAFLATKSGDSLRASILDGTAAAVYTWALLYAVVEKNLFARLLRACLVTATTFYLTSLMTGLMWSLIPWFSALFLILCVAFVWRRPLRSRRIACPESVERKPFG